MVILRQFFSNPVLISALSAWGLAQFLKIPIYYAISRHWDWDLLRSAGGMPSSHSALMVSATLSAGLHVGFDSPTFALAVAITMIVTYDAAGIRRQAGFQAEKINKLIAELFAGEPLSEDILKEVIGHTPRQVFVGIILGLLVAWVIWLLW
jgi:uncharacterized protein